MQFANIALWDRGFLLLGLQFSGRFNVPRTTGLTYASTSVLIRLPLLAKWKST